MRFAQVQLADLRIERAEVIYDPNAEQAKSKQVQEPRSPLAEIESMHAKDAQNGKQIHAAE